MKELENISGIYRITGQDGKVYIGSSNKIRNRWGKHRSDLRNRTHHSGYLQNVWNKHGEDWFVCEMIEECAVEDLLVREQWWIDELKPELNTSPVAGSNRGRVYSPEECQRISDRLIKTHCLRGHEYTEENTIWVKGTEGKGIGGRGHRTCRTCSNMKARETRARIAATKPSLREIAIEKRLAKTHCPNGHEWTPENTIYGKDGFIRHCRTCARAASNASYHKKQLALKGEQGT